MSGILPYLRSFRRQAAPSESDGELLRRFRVKRDEQAFAALVHRHGPMVLGIARRIVGQNDLAEDVFQATFLVAAQKARQLEHWPTIAGWLVQVTRRTALQAKAKATRRLRHEREAATTMTSTTASEPTRTAMQHDVAKLLDFELSRLPSKYRTPLVLCHLQGRTKEEAAQQLSWPVGSVSGRLARGKQLLKARLLRLGVVPTLATGVLSVPRLEAGIPPLLVQATTLLANSIVHKICPIPASAAVALAQGVMTSMYLTKMKWSATALLMLALCFSGGVWAVDAASSRVSVATRQDAASTQAQQPKVDTKPATLLHQLQGLWVLDDVNGNGPVITSADGLVRLAHKWWQFTDHRLLKAGTLDLVSLQTPYGFELDESKVPAHFNLISTGVEKGILKLDGDKLVIKLAEQRPLAEAIRPTDFERSANFSVYTLHRATDYDRLEGIWRKETRNPVTDELEESHEYIFRKNMYVYRWYFKKNTDKELRYVNENPPIRFELHENLDPKGIDWNIVNAQDLEKRYSQLLLDRPNNPRGKQFGEPRLDNLSERSLGIYQLTPNEFRFFTNGWIPLEVKDNHLVPNPNSPNSKRATSFTEAGDKLQIYKRVAQSLKDLPGVSSIPRESNSNVSELASNSNPSMPAASPKLQDLRQQRLKLAQERMDLARQAYVMGQMSLETMVPISQQLVEAKLAVTKDMKEKIQALEEQLQLVKQITEQTEQRYKAAACTKNELIAAQLRRLELEIQIEELKAQP